MILFERDWDYYPNAIIDDSTNNESFLELASLYKDMGLKHWYFPLALHDKTLAGLSPYSPDLTQEQKNRMVLEFDSNPWWYLREVIKDPKVASDPNDLARGLFGANRGNIAAMWLASLSMDWIQIQPRQTGKSFGIYSILNRLLYSTYRSTVMNFITKGEKTRMNVVKSLKDLRDAIPSFLIRTQNDDDNNTISLSCNWFDNKLFTNVAQSSAVDAYNMGRGLTTPCLILDEAAYIDHIQKTMAGASGGTNTARKIASMNNMPYFTAILTTTGNVNGRDGAFVHGLWLEAVTWDESFFDLGSKERFIQVLDANRSSAGTRVPMINLTFNHSQLGLTDEWLADSIERSGGSTADSNKDYMNLWEFSDDTSLVSKEVAARMNSSKMTPLKVDYYGDFMLRWFEEWDVREMYIIGNDTSNMLGRDDLGIVFTNARTGAVAATANVNIANVSILTNWIGKLLLDYPNTIYNPENKNIAVSILDYLFVFLPLNNIDPFKRIFNDVVQNPENHSKLWELVSRTDSSRHISTYTKNKSLFGFMTSKSSRELLFGKILKESTKECADTTRDELLVNQILGLREVNGRVDHDKDKHDDMAVSYLLTQYVLREGRNLFFYGLNHEDVLSNTSGGEIVTDDKNVSAEDGVYREFNSRIIKQIKDLNETLEDIKDDTTRGLMIAQMEYFKGLLVDMADEPLRTIDAMIEKARENNDSRFELNDTTTQRRSGHNLLEYYRGRM